MRPKLPPAASILPYLEQIDAERTYSNFGPLNSAFEMRLAARFGLKAASVTTLSNATAGLTLTLMAFGAKPDTLCVMPSWTFIASPHAASMAGFTPYFIDVDPNTWALDPAAVEKLENLPAEIGAIMPVAPFGSPLDGKAWDYFTDRTGIPVVIDAAAGFDPLRPTRTPAVVSLHATKVLGIGEGAFVVSTDEDIVAEVRARSNFGFLGSRTAHVAATNAKISEYQSAVGLAALDDWDAAQEEWMTVASAYRSAFANSNGFDFQAGFGQSWVGSVCVLKMPTPNGLAMERALSKAGFQTRRWWGDGAHRHPVAAQMPRGSLDTTELLVESTVAVPFYRDLDLKIVDRVAATLGRAG